MTRVLAMAIVVAMLGATLLATGCARSPGYNAYGRYQGTSNTSSPSDAAYDRLKSTDKDDWFKDRPM